MAPGGSGVGGGGGGGAGLGGRRATCAGGGGGSGDGTLSGAYSFGDTAMMHCPVYGSYCFCTIHCFPPETML